MSNKPIESFHAGNIEVAIWENQGEDSKIFHSASVKRTYMDGNGEWKDAGTVHLLPQHIPDMILALQKGHEHLRMGMRQKRRQQSAATGENGHSKDGDDSPIADPTESQGELMGEQTGSPDEGFVGKVGTQRGGGSRRSR